MKTTVFFPLLPVFFQFSMSTDAKQRIIGHMNADHHLAVLDYVVVYGKVDLSDLKPESAAISDVDDQYLTLTYELADGKSKSLELEWNLIEESQGVTVSSLRDAKDKLIAMAKYAAHKQGFSHTQITKVLPPTALSFPLYIYGLFLIVSSIDPTLIGKLTANDPLVAKALPYIPSTIRLVYNLTEQHALKIAITMYLLHVLEIVFSTLPKLKRYRVPPAQGLLWTVMHFFEGFFVILRFNTLRKD